MVAIQIGVDSVAEAVFVCSDSNYNLPAICIGRRIKKAVAFNARRIDDEHRAYSII
jgi:hypothetical protein